MGHGQRPHRAHGRGPVERSVTIGGHGVAATCAAHLLSKAGFTIHWERTGRPRVPAIMLSDSAVALARDVFQNTALLRNAHRIRRREVAWRAGEAPAVFEHAAVVVSEEELLSELPHTASAADPGNFELSATTPHNAVHHSFGHRQANVAHVTLKPGADSAACSIESFAEGWLFLVPNGGLSAWLLSVGDHLGSSRLIAPRIASVSPSAGSFRAHPAIAQPLSSPGRLAFGSAAMAFDPICGDGTAHAIREAVLASAAIRAIADGEPESAVRAHYESRLLLGFRRHLSLVLSFHRSGHGGNWWAAEAESTMQGIAWCDERVASFGPPRYRLEGAELKSLV